MPPTNKSTRKARTNGPLADLVSLRRELVERGPYHSIRVLHDEALLIFAPDGGVVGTGFCWQVELARQGPRLTLTHQTEVVAALVPWRDGAWKGHWREHINRPVLLLPGHPPVVAAATRPPVNVKIFGLQRSGTNYLQWLLEHNFSNVRVLVDHTGWKHGPVPDRIDWSGKDWHDPDWSSPAAATFVLRRLEELGPAGIAQLEQEYSSQRLTQVFIFKNPYAWCHSYARYRGMPLLPVASETVRLWCDRNRQWHSFAENHTDRSLFIAYEDLLARPTMVLAHVRGLGLERLSGPWRDVRRTMTPLGVPSVKDFDRGYYLRRCYLRNYDPENLAYVRRLLPPGLMRKLGYDREGNRLAPVARGPPGPRLDYANTVQQHATDDQLKS